MTATDLAGNASTKDVAVSLTTFSAFDLAIPKGIGLIHIPLSVTEVGGEKKTLATIGDLHAAIGDDKAFLITYDTESGAWRSYLGASNKGSASDVAITDDLGIITVRTAATDALTLSLKGNALGTATGSSITLKKGKNLVGVPLKDSRINTVAELLSLDDEGLATGAIVSDQGVFRRCRFSRFLGRLGSFRTRSRRSSSTHVSPSRPTYRSWKSIRAPAKLK